MRFAEKELFFKLFNENGFVMDFTTAKFNLFTFNSIGIRLCEKYGLSKGKSLEAFCNEAQQEDVFKLLSDLMDYYVGYISVKPREHQAVLYERCKKILQQEEARIEEKNKKTKQKQLSKNITELKEGETIQRSKSYSYIRKLGEGASGGTYLFQDLSTKRKVAIKKSEPIEGENDETFKRFVNEAEILTQINHPNIVRIFDYDLYEQRRIGYIYMEYIEGKPIGTEAPESFNRTWEDWFEETIRAFYALERKKIIHRDIRPSNILVDREGRIKIIDFGFGRIISSSADLHNSISLAWITSKKPEELQMLGEYGRGTDIYFLGVLFKQVIPSEKLDSFRYKKILNRMDVVMTDKRISSFREILLEIQKSASAMNTLSKSEISIYRAFSIDINKYLIQWAWEPVFEENEETVVKNLCKVSEESCLEEYVPVLDRIVRCFVNGAGYKYNTLAKMESSVLSDFCSMLSQSSRDKQSLIIRNIKNKLSSIKIEEKKDLDIPF